MKNITKGLLIIFTLTFMLFKPTTVTYADITEQDNLVVELQVVPVETADNEVKAILTITNNTTAPVINVNIDNVIPEGMRIKDENDLTKEIGTINSGETATHEFYCIIDELIVDADNETVILAPETNNDNTTNNGEEVKLISSNNDVNQVKTNDDNMVLPLVLAIIVSSILLVLLTKKKSKNVKKFMSLFIGLPLMATLLGTSVLTQAAENSHRELSVRDSITINDNVYNFETIVKYELSPIESAESSIKGAISKAIDRNVFLNDALVEIFDESGNTLIAETTSNNNGEYEFNLNPGTYKVKISKDGYIPFESIEVVLEGEETYIQTYLMVAQGEEGQESFAGGKITNAVTGQNVSGATINVRAGWNTSSGTTLKTTTTNTEGKYKVQLPLGNYTIEMIKDGYITKHYNIYVIEVDALNQNNTLVPDSSEIETGNLRIVLTWEETPRDLDSHLVGPTADGTDKFHTSYYNKKYSEDSIKYADLDLDDTSSYGPETTTIYKMNNEGKYSFYVHNYSNSGSLGNVAMSNSGAKVDVYKGETLYATYNIPTNNEGVYWHVFDFDAATGVITPVNEFFNGSARFLDQDSNSNSNSTNTSTLNNQANTQVEEDTYVTNEASSDQQEAPAQVEEDTNITNEPSSDEQEAPAQVEEDTNVTDEPSSDGQEAPAQVEEDSTITEETPSENVENSIETEEIEENLAS